MHFRRERRNGVVVSLQETLEAGKEDSALTLSDVLQDGFCMEDACERQDEARRLRRLIEGLPARERKLILLRYGLAGQPPLTQLETAQLLQISRSYVSRLETHALEQLRKGWLQYSKRHWSKTSALAVPSMLVLQCGSLILIQDHFLNLISGLRINRMCDITIFTISCLTTWHGDK